MRLKERLISVRRNTNHSTFVPTDVSCSFGKDVLGPLKADRLPSSNGSFKHRDGGEGFGFILHTPLHC